MGPQGMSRRLKGCSSLGLGLTLLEALLFPPSFPRNGKEASEYLQS